MVIGAITNMKQITMVTTLQIPSQKHGKNHRNHVGRINEDDTHHFMAT